MCRGRWRRDGVLLNESPAAIGEARRRTLRLHEAIDCCSDAFGRCARGCRGAWAATPGLRKNEIVVSGENDLDSVGFLVGR